MTSELLLKPRRHYCLHTERIRTKDIFLRVERSFDMHSISHVDMKSVLPMTFRNNLIGSIALRMYYKSWHQNEML